MNILHRANGKGVSFNQILRTVRGRGFPSIMILFSLPLMLPIPLPGLSVPMGVAIFFFGIRIAVGKRPLVPRWLLKRNVAYSTLERIIHKAVPWVVRLEKLLCPRMHFLQRWPVFRMVNGAAIALCGIALLLPLPIPFTNGVPAIAVTLLSAGMMEEDGLFILLGYVVTVAAWAYLFALAWMGHLSLEAIRGA